MAIVLLLAQLDRVLLRHTKNMQLGLGLMLFGLALGPSTCNLWLEARSLNANFYYATTLILSAGHALLVYDIVGAALGCDEQTHSSCTLAARRLQRSWRRRTRVVRAERNLSMNG